MTKTYAISNGTTAEISYNAYMDDYVMHNFDGDDILGLGRFPTMEEAESKLRKLAKMWGGFTVAEI